jgi:hypothetical protein
MLQQALRTDPELVDAYLHLALAQVRLGENDAAKSTIETAVARFPAQEELFRHAYAQMTESPHPAAGSAAAAALSGTVDLDASLKGAVGPGTTVFIAVRPAGVSAGPPVAAKRLPAHAFPLRFSITDADSMAGGTLPPKVRIEARADADGDLATRDPGDPRATLDGVAVGSSDLRLVLKR